MEYDDCRDDSKFHSGLLVYDPLDSVPTEAMATIGMRSVTIKEVRSIEDNSVAELGM